MQEIEHALIGRYQIQQHLIKGGMADIYLARDVETGQTVAVKLVQNSSDDYYERFRREANVLTSLSHPHILPVYTHGEYNSWYYLISPYIEYGTLNKRLSQGTLTLDEADFILAQITEALQYAHDRGIIHRDIKPTNVLMQDGYYAFLADFGLVKQIGSDEHSLALSGYLIGTPEYMAPELADSAATPRSDIYALGILLYQMLTGRVPFKATTPIGVFLHQVQTKPQRPSAHNPTIPEAVDHVVLRALAKIPAKRYQSAQEFYQAFHSAVQQVNERRHRFEKMQTLFTGIPRSPSQMLSIGHKYRRVEKRHTLLTFITLLVMMIALPLVLSLTLMSNSWLAFTHQVFAGNTTQTNASLAHVPSPPLRLKPTLTPTPTPTPRVREAATQTIKPTPTNHAKTTSPTTNGSTTNRHTKSGGNPTVASILQRNHKGPKPAPAAANGPKPAPAPAKEPAPVKG